MNEINSTSFPAVPATYPGQPWNYAAGNSFDLLASGATDDASRGFLKYQAAPEDTLVDPGVEESNNPDTGETVPTPANEGETMQMAETRESPLFVDGRAEGGGDPY